MAGVGMKFGLPPWLKRTSGAAESEPQQAEAPAPELIEPTEEEAKNGWTAEALTAYVAERSRAQDGIIMFDPKYRRRARPRWANSRYSLFRWRARA